MRCLIQDFQKENPEIHIEIVDGNGSEICSFIESKRLNLGFSLLDPTLPECIKTIPILSMEQVILMKAQHHLAKEDYITPAMLNNQKIVIAAFSSVPAQTLCNVLEQDNASAQEIFATVDLPLPLVPVRPIIISVRTSFVRRRCHEPCTRLCGRNDRSTSDKGAHSAGKRRTR